MAYVVRTVVPPESVEDVSVTAAVAASSGVAEVPAGNSVLMLVGFDDLSSARAFADAIAPLPAGIEQPDDGAWEIGTVVVERRGRHIELDVGTSFGHGSHPTTELALDAIDALGSGLERSLLDVGCGTGVLSIWAARAGFVTTGCDVDPAAVARSLANAERNGVTDRARFVVGAPTDLAGAGTLGPVFDIAAVNALIGVHEAEGAAILGLLGSGATMIVTGARTVQEERLLGAYAGWCPVSRRQRDGWVQLVLEKN